MSVYTLFTDSSCDIKADLLNSWGVKSCSLTFHFTTDEREYTDSETDIATFYNTMRSGGIAKTSAVNTDVFLEAFESELKNGNDVLYLGFSTGLSSTFNAGRLAAETLREKYPDRKILTVDSLAASAGQGLMVKLAKDKRDAGATIEECAEFLEGIKLNIDHWFIVDDLVYLKRGGRISPFLAFAGNALGLKPVLHVDNEGHLVSVSKARGRRNALNALADKYGELTIDNNNYPIFISHADSEADAKYLADTIKEKYGREVELITDVGPVIGSHSGPGTMALFFVGKER